MRIFTKLYNFLSSVRLTIVLLILILISCVVGAALMPAQAARVFIFSSLWFNSLLVLLIINVAFCFFPRIRRRKIDLIFAGMIIFHLSFILLFVGIVYDSMFYFRGVIRLTEGETLDIGSPQSYDRIELGRFFNPEKKLKGQINLRKLHTRYIADGMNKGVADEIEVGREITGIKTNFIYTTRHLEFEGLKFYRNQDGFSLLFVLRDKKGDVFYGAYSPIQSLKQTKGKYLYTTGTPEGSGPILFPQDPVKPLFNLQAIYFPDPKKDRTGDVSFHIRQFNPGHNTKEQKELFKGRSGFGERVKIGDYYLSMEEVRFWASMDVRYNPGLPLILTSLWIGLSGIILTTAARLIKRK